MLFVEEPLLSVGIVTDKIITFELHGDFSVFGFKDNFSGVYTAEIKNNEITCKSSKHEVKVNDKIEFIPTDPISESFLLKRC